MKNIERLEKRLELYYQCEEKILSGQEYKIGTRTLRRADLSEVTNMIEALKKEIAYEKRGRRNKAVRGIPLDI